MLKKVSDFDSALLDRRVVSGWSFSIPESNYWLIASGFVWAMFNTPAANGISLDVRVLTGESNESGYKEVYTDVVQSDAEVSFTLVWVRGRDVFKRFSSDADTNKILEMILPLLFD